MIDLRGDMVYLVIFLAYLIVPGVILGVLVVLIRGVHERSRRRRRRRTNGPASERDHDPA